MASPRHAVEYSRKFHQYESNQGFNRLVIPIAQPRYHSLAVRDLFEIFGDDGRIEQESSVIDVRLVRYENTLEFVDQFAQSFSDIRIRIRHAHRFIPARIRQSILLRQYRLRVHKILGK